MSTAAATRRFVVAPEIGNTGLGAGKILGVWAASTIINLTLLVCAYLLFTFLGGLGNDDEDEPEPEKPTPIQEDKKPDLSNPDIGLDSSVPLNYDVDRIDKVSVPGPVDPTAPVGIKDAAEAPPMNVPPPPGTGGATGGAIQDPNIAGTGSMTGTLGGYGGSFNPGGFGGRSGATRQRMVTEGGGNKYSEAAVGVGLKWLAHHQNSRGYWSLNSFNKDARTAPLPAGKVVGDNSQPGTTRDNKIAGTAFGLLPFLAAGQTHRPPAKGTTVIDYSKGINAALVWLMAQQKKTGADDVRGSFSADMYAHGLASIAMCEAYGLTSDPRFKASAQLALDFIMNAQHSGGGWRYSYKSAGDTSVTGWQLMALKSGQMAGLRVNRSTLKAVERYLDSCESGNKSGKYGYLPGRNAGYTPAMTAVGGLCRQYLGVNPLNKSLQNTVDYLGMNPPGAGGIYYEYYATQVMHHMGGPAWDYWNLGTVPPNKKWTKHKGIRDSLIARQVKGAGGNAGSWAGTDHVGGRLGATSLCLLSLEVYYRHLPLYRRDGGAMKK